MPTPPVLWGDESFVSIGVIPSPAPIAERDGWRIVLRGVRFTHMAHCPSCRRAINTATEGGLIALGFDSNGKSFETYTAGGCPNFTGECPHCGKSLRITDPVKSARRGFPAADAYALVRTEWERLRGEVGVKTVDMSPADLTRLTRRRKAGVR